MNVLKRAAESAPVAASVAVLAALAITGKGAVDAVSGKVDQSPTIANRIDDYKPIVLPNTNGTMTVQPGEDLTGLKRDLAVQASSNTIESAGAPETPAAVTAAEAAAVATAGPSGPTMEQMQSSANMAGDQAPTVH